MTARAARARCSQRLSDSKVDRAPSGRGAPAEECAHTARSSAMTAPPVPSGRVIRMSKSATFAEVVGIGCRLLGVGLGEERKVDMSSSLRARLTVVALVTGMGLMVAVPAAQGAEFGFEKLFAANCEKGHENCGAGAKEPTEVKEAEEVGFRTAGAYVPFGVSDFVLNHEVIQTVPFEAIGPAEFFTGGSAKNLRFDAGPGVVTNPEAVGKCTLKDFTSTEVA